MKYTKLLNYYQKYLKHLIINNNGEKKDYGQKNVEI